MVPILWNNLDEKMQNSVTLSAFKWTLKTKMRALHLAQSHCAVSSPRSHVSLVLTAAIISMHCLHSTVASQNVQTICLWRHDIPVLYDPFQMMITDDT